MRAYRISLTILLVLIMGSCSHLSFEAMGVQDSTPSEPQKIPFESASSTPAPIPSIQESKTQLDPSLPIPAIPGIEPLIEKAKDDLAQRLAVSTSQIRLMDSKEVFWSDASLGCPQPGTAYIQTVTPGYLIILETSGKEFEYHANIHNHIFYCENPISPVSEKPANTQQ